METKDYRIFVRNRIIELITQHDMSEYSLSHALGKSSGYINSITSGKTLPSLDALFAICDYFQITPDEFFTSELEPRYDIRKITELLKGLSPDSLPHVETLLKHAIEIKKS